MLGMTCKENCSDPRNSNVVDIIPELNSDSLEVQVRDLEAEPKEAQHKYDVELLSWNWLPRVGAVVAAVTYRQFATPGPTDVGYTLAGDECFIDVNSAFDQLMLANGGCESATASLVRRPRMFAGLPARPRADHDPTTLAPAPCASRPKLVLSYDSFARRLATQGSTTAPSLHSPRPLPGDQHA